MRMPWNKSKVEQLDLVDEANEEHIERPISDAIEGRTATGAATSSTTSLLDNGATEGVPLLVSIDRLEQDPCNPRTEFPEEEIAELAQDIAQRGILQPIVVHRLTEDGRYRVLFGAKRLRAAKQAGLKTVPVRYRLTHSRRLRAGRGEPEAPRLSALDLAKFMRSRVDAGESNAEIARRMGIDLTTVAHHLALLTLPPDLEEALRTGRCTSPKPLYELAKLHDKRPDQVKSMVAREGHITRNDVTTLKVPPPTREGSRARESTPPRKPSLSAQADDLCQRLELLLARMTRQEASVTPAELDALRQASPLSLPSSGGVGRSDPPISSRCISMKTVNEDGRQDRLRPGNGCQAA
jgi:ParB family chromosome partitioning protein